MSVQTKVFAGKEFNQVEPIEVDGTRAACWSCPTEWSGHPIIVCERSDEMWMLYDARTGQEAVAIDLVGVEIVLQGWFSQAQTARIRAAIARATA